MVSVGVPLMRAQAQHPDWSASTLQTTRVFTIRGAVPATWNRRLRGRN